MIPLAKVSQISPATAGFPTAPVTVASIVGGYAVARATKRRGLGGAALAGGGAWCTWRWQQGAGTATAAGLLGVYLAAFGVSHPLAKRIGAWPSVVSVSAVAGMAAWALADRRG